MRVVSLVPSVTETLLAWDVQPVAVTRFCEQPSLRTVGGTKNPDVAAIVALAPDVVVMNDEENRIEDAATLREAGLDVHVVTVRRVADVAPAFAALAARLGVPGGIDEPRPRDPAVLRAFVPIWRRPWMTLNADTYGSSILACCGVTNVFADRAERYPAIAALDEVSARMPDVVLAPSEPYAFGERHRAELEQVAPAVFVDGRDLFWWGVRSAAAVDRMTSILGA